MNSIYILITVVAVFGQPPRIIYQEVNSLDTCKSMSIEVKRMVNKVRGNHDVETFCHPKEIK